MLIIFSVNDQKITHDLKGQLVAGSVDIVQAAFKFDSSWDELDKIVVFTSSACPKPVPVQFADEAFYIPKDVLKPGKLYVSVVGFGLDGRKKTTQKWDIMQAITVQKCGDGGDCDLLRYLAQGQVADGKVAKDEEVKDKVTASITDGAITKAKLETEVQTALNKAHEHANKALLDTYDQTNANIKDAVSKKHSHANAAELDKIATGDKAKWDATSTKVEGIAEGATKVEASTTEGNIKINGVETAVVTIATDTEVTEMPNEVFGATA